MAKRREAFRREIPLQLDALYPEARMQDKKTTFIYRIIRWFVWLFSPKFRTVGLEKLPDEACIIVGNHSQMYGPIAAEIFLPGRHEIWCAGQMMHRDEVAAYAFEDFWSFKPRWTHGFFRLLSRLITPLSVCVFNNAHTIPVYHGRRVAAWSSFPRKTYGGTTSSTPFRTNSWISPVSITKKPASPSPSSPFM